MKEELVEILKEEEAYRFDEFNATRALKIGNYIANYAIMNKLQVCTDIYANGKTYFHFSSDACIPDNDNWLTRKKNTVLYFHHSSRFIHRKLQGDSSLLSSKYGVESKDYAVIDGGFPIYVRNCGVIGAICVSGLLPNEDHQLILEAITSTKQ